MATKSRAKLKGVKFDLSMDQFIGLVSFGSCHYCGVHSGNLTLDRCMPSDGYTYANVVSSCRNCNTVKNNILTYAEMRALAKMTKDNPLGSRV